MNKFFKYLTIFFFPLNFIIIYGSLETFAEEILFSDMLAKIKLVQNKYQNSDVKQKLFNLSKEPNKIIMKTLSKDWKAITDGIIGLIKYKKTLIILSNTFSGISDGIKCDSSDEKMVKELLDLSKTIITMQFILSKSLNLILETSSLIADSPLSLLIVLENEEIKTLQEELKIFTLGINQLLFLHKLENDELELKLTNINSFHEKIAQLILYNNSNFSNEVIELKKNIKEKVEQKTFKETMFKMDKILKVC